MALQPLGLVASCSGPGSGVAWGRYCYSGLGPLQDGDVVEMEGAGLGRLRVDVKDALRREWPRLTRAQKEAAETKGPAG